MQSHLAYYAELLSGNSYCFNHVYSIYNLFFILSFDNDGSIARTTYKRLEYNSSWQAYFLKKMRSLNYLFSKIAYQWHILINLQSFGIYISEGNPLIKKFKSECHLCVFSTLWLYMYGWRSCTTQYRKYCLNKFFQILCEDQVSEQILIH